VPRGLEGTEAKSPPEKGTSYPPPTFLPWNKRLQ
jgi:hypothetical protein